MPNIGVFTSGLLLLLFFIIIIFLKQSTLAYIFTTIFFFVVEETVQKLEKLLARIDFYARCNVYDRHFQQCFQFNGNVMLTKTGI